MRCHTHSHLGLRRGPRAFYLVLTPCRYTQTSPPELSTRADQDCFPCRSAQYSELSFQCAPLVLPGLNSPPTYRHTLLVHSSELEYAFEMAWPVKKEIETHVWLWIKKNKKEHSRPEFKLRIDLIDFCINNGIIGTGGIRLCPDRVEALIYWKI